MYHVFILFVLFFASCLLSTNSSQAAVLAKNKIWKNHNELNVLFLDGTKAQKDLVKKISPLWVVNSRLKLVFFEKLTQAPKQTHIRVSFKHSTGSILGDHGDYLSKEPTLQLEELNHYDLSSTIARRYVLHEFGHALGFEHEFLNPNWPYGIEPIQKQVASCLTRIRGFNNQQKAHQHCESINRPLNHENSFSTIYDKHSIMNYPLTIDRKGQSSVIIKAKTQLSTLDKLAMERWYGKKK